MSSQFCNDFATSVNYTLGEKNYKNRWKGFPLTVKQASSLPAKKGRIIWIISILAVIAIAGGYFYYSNVYSNSTTSNSLQTQTAVVRRGNLVVSASGSGTLISNSDATFGFDTSGRVAKVDVKVGDQVQQGQVLAE